MTQKTAWGYLRDNVGCQELNFINVGAMVTVPGARNDAHHVGCPVGAHCVQETRHDGPPATVAKRDRAAHHPLGPLDGSPERGILGWFCWSLAAGPGFVTSAYEKCALGICRVRRDF